MKQIFLVILLMQSWLCLAQASDKADSLFSIANSRTKRLDDQLDSTTVAQSLADLSEAIRLKPDFCYAYRNRSRLHMKTGHYQDAVEDLTKAIHYASQTDVFYLRDLRAYAYYALGKYTEAILDWNLFIPHSENPELALLHRAKAYWKLGQPDHACTDYQQAIRYNKKLTKEREFIECK